MSRDCTQGDAGAVGEGEEMIVRVERGLTGFEPRPINLRCPGCRQHASLEGIGVHDFHTHDAAAMFAQRRCPNPTCHAHLFLIYSLREHRVLVSYPAERLDFDPTNIPSPVVAVLEKAITCHANSCFTAAAIMVRKTLEELCRDRKATGANLKERLKALRSAVVLPPELLDGLDDLRLLGNDAAHVESEVFNKIGQEEVEVGVAFTKEVLKAVYQYSALLDRLRKLKKP
jgi:Domain of unknown function (DUF4145)